jgi:hypothetical protein
MENNDFEIMGRVHPTLTGALDPRQQKYIEAYFGIDSATFGNSYQSALLAGYSDETSRNLSHNRPRWLSEILGQIDTMEPQHLLLRLVEIINDTSEPTAHRLRAIDMMMKYHRMYGTSATINNVAINIESVL